MTAEIIFLAIDMILVALFIAYCGLIKDEAGPNSLATTPTGKAAMLTGLSGAAILLAGAVVFFTLLAFGAFTGIVVIDLS